MDVEVLIRSLPLAPTSVTVAASRSSKQPALAFIVSPGSGAPRAPSCGDRPWDQRTFSHGTETELRTHARRTRRELRASSTPVSPSPRRRWFPLGVQPSR